MKRNFELCLVNSPHHRHHQTAKLASTLSSLSLLFAIPIRCARWIPNAFAGQSGMHTNSLRCLHSFNVEYFTVRSVTPQPAVVAMYFALASTQKLLSSWESQSEIWRNFRWCYTVRAVPAQNSRECLCWKACDGTIGFFPRHQTCRRLSPVIKAVHTATVMAYTLHGGANATTESAFPWNSM